MPRELLCKCGDVNDNILYATDGKQYELINVTTFYKTKNDVMLLHYLTDLKKYEVLRHLVVKNK